MKKHEIYNEILKMQGFWSNKGPNSDVVISSRIRLARNMNNISFHNKLEDSEIKILYDSLEKFLIESKYAQDSTLIDLNDITGDEKRLLRERNIITSEMENSKYSGVIINNTNEFTILVNEEDNIRIQVIKPGLQLLEVYRIADNIDDEVNKYIPYAFSDQLGYLTACPSNLGTGMRASVLLHLPVLALNKKIAKISSDLKDAGVEIKGTLPDNLGSHGNIYQISNRVSLGYSEIDIIDFLDDHVNRIISFEDKERDAVLSKNRIDLEDKIHRSFDLLTHAKKLSYVEAMDNLSNVRLGIVLAIIKNNELQQINDIMVNIQQSHLLGMYKSVFKNTDESDVYRAGYIKNKIYLR